MIDLKTLLFPSFVTVLTLMLFFVITINVGRARAKYKVPAPQTSGEPNFERVFRVQQNTLEQLVIFLPSLWLFSLFVSPILGSGIGALWIIGRIIYAWGYYQAAEKRFIGFGISALSILVLLIGSLVGIIRTFTTLVGSSVFMVISGVYELAKPYPANCSEQPFLGSYQ